jgi:hypothetical protein
MSEGGPFGILSAFRRWLALALVCGAASIPVVSSAQAASNASALDALIPLLAKAGAGARATQTTPQVLPTVKGKGAPFRQTVVGDCKYDSPLADLAFTFCRFQPITIPSDRLLEIKNVSCLTLPVYGAFFLSTSGNVGKLFNSLIGIVINATSSPQGGPFYVAPGENLFIWGLGAPGSSAFCTVHGLLSSIE